MTPEPFEIRGRPVEPGTRADLRLPIGEDYLGDRLTIPVTVVHGARPGPVLAVTAAIHGDELNGIGICRDVLGAVFPDSLAGTLVCVPIVNMQGVALRSRYLPDRRDLNRHFPGSPDGSTASRLAHAIMSDVVTPADVGVDLHTAASHRTNEPHVRASLADERARALGLAFGVGHLIDASVRPGSLRDAAARIGVPVLTYEGGAALRFDADAIDAGARGTLRVMAALGMVDDAPKPYRPLVMESDETTWVRANRGGILEVEVQLGEEVDVGRLLWTVSDPQGSERSQRTAPVEGVVIGVTTLPLVTPGDAVVHLARNGRHEQSSIDEPTDEEDDDDVDLA